MRRSRGGGSGRGVFHVLSSLASVLPRPCPTPPEPRKDTPGPGEPGDSRTPATASEPARPEQTQAAMLPGVALSLGSAAWAAATPSPTVPSGNPARQVAGERMTGMGWAWPGSWRSCPAGWVTEQMGAWRRAEGLTFSLEGPLYCPFPPSGIFKVTLTFR